MKAEFYSWIRSIGGGVLMAATFVLAVPVVLVLGLLGFLDTKKNTPKG